MAAPRTGQPRAGAAAGGRLRVAVIAGGRSSEHDVSLSSGAAVRDGLLAQRPRRQFEDGFHGLGDR